jgi:hypothetical protein
VDEVEVEPISPYSGYTKHIGKDVRKSDILCNKSGVAKEFCKTKCDDDTKCIGYNYIHPGGVWGDKSGCCIKNNETKGVLIDGDKIDFYMKN